MLKVTNNPELLKLIGMKFHVQEVTKRPDFPEEIRDFLASAALNAERYVHSVIFNADAPPEIGLVTDMAAPDDMEFISASALVFSRPSGSSQPFPDELFDSNGILIASRCSQAQAA